ncbi:MAG: C25 family cysteine peptidase, partial [Candidatus Electryonea clarkiae]|nr:C25 family cysteine peptidase [Candidatus Electryonea clarkiae]
MKYRDGLFVIACVLIFISNSRARNISPNQELPIQVSNRIISSNGMRLTLEIAEPEWRTIDSGNERVSFANYNLMTGYLEERGLPSVPVTSRTFRLPPRKSARLEILETNYETYTDIDYAAYFGGSTPGELGQIKSPGDSWYPGKLAELSNPSNRHDFRVSSLITYPVQVNPARREVRVYNRIDVDIHFEEDNNSDLPDQIPARISKTFLPWYRQFLDWDENELDEYELYRGGVQVVMPDDEDLWDDLDPWIEWKLQKGWELDFLTDNDVDDWEAEDIQEELRDRYQAQPFDYVVIIGDADGSYATPAGINVTNTDYGIFADYYYQLMDDDDIYQDVIVGRISVRNGTELERYVQKVLSYECDPYMDDTDWYLQGACLAIYDYHPIGGTSVCEYIRSELFNIGYTDVFYYSSPNGPEPARSNLITHINDGVSYFQCSGAIADGLTRQQILNLTNENKPFVAIQLSHGTGKWSVETAAISEAFIRAWNNGEPTGAIGAFGQATNRANWGYENSFAAGAFYTTARLRLPTLGQMLWGGQKNMFIDFYPYRTGTYTYQNYAECINLMGDPLVWLWTDIPAELDIDAEESIVLGQHSYPVEISDEDGNPVEGAWVTMYKSDDNEYEIVRGESAGDGSILLNLPFEYTGEAVLTVTAQNFQPVQIDVDIDEPDNRIGYTTVNIIDDGEDGTSGNDNGIPEPGETVGLEIDIKNFGGNRQTNISLTASSDDTWIEEIEGSITLDALGPGAEANGTGMILIEISHEAQDRWLNHLELTLESDQDTYTDDYSLKIFAPAYLLLEVSGSEDLEPGETSEIAVEIMNTGGADASASEGHMRILHSFGGMVEPDAEFEAMDIGDAASATFEIRSHMVAIPGFQVPAMLIVTTEDEHLDTVWFSIPLGTRSESEPCGPDRYGYWAYDNRDTDYEKSPEYDWVEISPNANDTDYEGTLQIEDAREGGGEAPVIALPFQVQYYGNDFDSITISNYGWAAFGNQAQFYGTSKNSPIPGPYGPYNMLAPFWDERYFSTDEDGAYTYYDEENGRFIIEWFESKGWLGGGSYSQPCTYEIIIYDRNEQHNTRTGDNEILFQYKNGEIDPHIGYARCNPWWTTGIKDGTQTDGLMYYYHVTPSPGAVDDDNDFDDELSILFTTDVRIIAGSIAGTVTNSITDDPVEGIRVTLDDNYYETFTNEEGQFLLEGVHVGQYSVSFDDECFTDTMLTDIAIAEDETTYVDMPLRHPLLSLDPVEFEEA